MRPIIVWIILIIFLFFAKTNVFAVSVEITNFPSSITDQSFTLSASVSGATIDTNFIKVDIYKDGTSNYFGETFNGTDWYSGSTYTQYLPINIQNGGYWSGTIQARAGGPNLTNYPGAGVYKLRVRRYTSGGGYTTSEANSSAVNISVALPTPTNIPTVSPTPQPTITLTPTPTAMPLVTNTPTPTISTKLPVISENQQSSVSASSQQVLGQRDNSLFAIPSGTDNKDKNILTFSASDNKIISGIFMFIGLVFIVLCVIVIIYPRIEKLIKFKKNE